MRVLLTGAGGWLGRSLAPLLRSHGHEVVGLDAAASPFTDVQGSVADRAFVAELCETRAFEGVLHAAALHKPDLTRYPAQDFIDVNVTGTLNLLEAAPRARFVFTSTTSLMISQAIRDEQGERAVWLDEDTGPLAPRNLYGVTKLAAEGLCRVASAERGTSCVILRTGRFFPEDDDTLHDWDGANLKANELLHRRLTVEDCAEAHRLALEKAPEIGFGLYVVSAPTPFRRDDAAALKRDAAGVIARYYPDAAALYERAGWRLPGGIGRVYDSARAEKELGFRARVDFAAVLAALRDGTPPPFAHDPGYVSPSARSA